MQLFFSFLAYRKSIGWYHIQMEKKHCKTKSLKVRIISIPKTNVLTCKFVLNLEPFKHELHFYLLYCYQTEMLKK